MKTSTNIPSQNPEAFLQPPERKERSARGATRSTARLRSLTVLAAILLSLAHAQRAHAALMAFSGTGQIGNGVSLSIVKNSKQLGGSGNTVGGKVHSPSGAPNLFFRAAITPTFPGALSTLVEWSPFGAFGGGQYSPIPFEGAQSGTDNWMKVIRDGDGAVSWAQFNFDLTPSSIGSSPTLISIPLYVASSDGADFTLAQAVAAATTPVPEPTTTLIGLACAGIALHRRRRR